jgi:hypothetical protein
VVSIPELLHTEDAGSVIPAEEASALAGQLGELAGMAVYPRSLTLVDRGLFFLGRRGPDRVKLLGILSAKGCDGFQGSRERITVQGEPCTLQLCDTGHGNAVGLRRHLPFTSPGVLGLRGSIGCGDRLGLATPGHVRAVERHALAPVFAQQSMREMSRAGRTPEDVLDDATWGVLQEGWRSGFGADADHLKTSVDDSADRDDPGTLDTKLAGLPWGMLDASQERLREIYLGGSFTVGGMALAYDELCLRRAAVKYGGAVAHAVGMSRHLTSRMGESTFELEVSLDETRTPTSVMEHHFVASELKRLGVTWVSLAPNFVGRFEKGVDYMGDLSGFEKAFAGHAAVAADLGPYKLGIHSGSDKFSIYPIIARLSGDRVHLKTAGTSYLVALRVLAEKDPSLFREILAFALERYEEDRATYHVSADPSRVREDREDLAAVVHGFDERQVLHVTFGSVLAAGEEGEAGRFRGRLMDALGREEEAYYEALRVHLERHLTPFDH